MQQEHSAALRVGAGLGFYPHLIICWAWPRRQIDAQRDRLAGIWRKVARHGTRYGGWPSIAGEIEANWHSLLAEVAQR